MDPDATLLAVRISSARARSLALSSEERAEVSRELRDVAMVRWLPQTIVTEPGVQGSSEYTTIVIFVLGVAFGAIVKPFWDGFASEAGKDLWNALKRTAARIWKAQADKSYRLDAKVSIVLELGDEFVVIECHPGSADRGVDLGTLEEAIQAELIDMGKNWDEIHKIIGRFQVGHKFGMAGAIREAFSKLSGKQSVTGIHRIHRSGDGGWTIDADRGEWSDRWM